MKIGCCSVAFRKYDLDFALEKIADAQYEYVEVEANLKWCSHLDTWKDDPIVFRDKIKRLGFKGTAAIGSHREIITSEQGAKDIEQSLIWAHAAGVPVVITGEGRIPQDMTQKDALKILKERLEKLSEVAEKNRVYLAMEDHGSISITPDGLPKILSLVKSDWLAVNFDTANIHRGDYIGTDQSHFEWKLGARSGSSETELLNKVAARAKHVHFKDVVGRNAVVLGEGEIDLIGCVKILKMAEFDGVLSYETEGWEDWAEAEKMIRESRKFMLDALKDIRA
jgi:sugar phosphate isomerase/epimerase